MELLSTEKKYLVHMLFLQDDIFCKNVLSFLEATDLCQFGVCSVYCANVSVADHLWAALLDRDFTNVTTKSREDAVIMSKKEIYKAKMIDVSRTIDFSKNLQRMHIEEIQMEQKLSVLQRCLDFTQFRAFLIVPFLSFFVSLILFALHFGGVDMVSIWACFGPLYFSLFYIFACILVSCYLRKQEGNIQSSIHSYWDTLHSPLYMVYNYLRHVKGAIAVCFTIYLLICAQFIFLGVKLSADVSEQTRDNFRWELVFLPMWILLILSCIFPLMMEVNCGAFVVGIILVWIPATILFGCLAAKLDDKQSTSGSNLSLDIILTPFWVIEGVFIVGSAIFCAVGFRKYMNGFQERMDQHIGICMGTWCFFLPFILCQALLSVRDHGDKDQKKSGVSVAGALSPLMVVAGILLIFVTLVVYKGKTAFELRREQRHQDMAGSTVLFDV